MNQLPSSPLAKRLDLALERGEVFATAELKATATGNFCHWVVSGMSVSGLPSMLLDLAVPLAAEDESGMLIEAEEFARKYIFPIAEELRKTSGAGERIPQLGVNKRGMLFEAHMEHHFSALKAGNLTLQRQTEALFMMATFLEVLTPVKLIAKFHRVAVGTVESRIQRGRASGAIPKASEVRARKEILKKGQ
jgi:hypothetical protein